MSGAIIGTCEPRCNRKTSTERRCRAPRTTYAMRDGIRFSLTWFQCDITMQSAVARTARGLASSPSQSGARRRGRHANAGAVVKGTHNERGKATQGQVGLRHARRRGGGAHRHHRPLYLEHHRAREHAPTASTRPQSTDGGSASASSRFACGSSHSTDSSRCSPARRACASCSASTWAPSATRASSGPTRSLARAWADRPGSAR